MHLKLNTKCVFLQICYWRNVIVIVPKFAILLCVNYCVLYLYFSMYWFKYVDKCTCGNSNTFTLIILSGVNLYKSQRLSVCPFIHCAYINICMYFVLCIMYSMFWIKELQYPWRNWAQWSNEINKIGSSITWMGLLHTQTHTIPHVPNTFMHINISLVRPSVGDDDNDITGLSHVGDVPGCGW